MPAKPSGRQAVFRVCRKRSIFYMRSKGKPAHTGCHSLPWPFEFTHIKKRYHPLGSIPFHCWHILVWGTRPALRGGPGRGSDSPPGCHSLPLPFESPVALWVFTREKRGTAFWVVPLSTVGAPRGTRTLDLLIRSQTLYPAELVAHQLPHICDNIIYIITRRGICQELKSNFRKPSGKRASKREKPAFTDNGKVPPPGSSGL